MDTGADRETLAHARYAAPAALRATEHASASPWPDAALAPLLAPLVPRPFPVDALVLFGEDERGMFHVLHRYALTG